VPAEGAEAATSADAAEPATAPASSAPAAVDRRSFVRAIAGESVTTAGRIAGISGALAGSVITAARAASEGFAALGAPSAPPSTAPTAVAPKVSLPVPAAPAPVAAVPLPLTDADRGLLERLQLGLLATNQPGAAPAVGIVRFVFDGAVFRIPGRSATARTANLQRDPFAALTVIDPETGDALLLAGRSRILYGGDGRDAAAEVLAACGVTLPDGWAAADSRGDPVLMVLTPQRLFRRRAADERP
jgi:hypothetical protein